MSVPCLAVVGHPNKGKSSIVATLAHDDSIQIGPEPGTTRRVHRYSVRVDDELLYELLDSPGFQRPRRALHWLKLRETTAARHPDVVRDFISDRNAVKQFPEETEILSAIMEGAGILYVVDGSVPYGPEYEAEMEILRWAGRASMALINPIGESDYIEEWRSALQQYFSTVRVFNALVADFNRQIDLLRSFAEIDDRWRPALLRAVEALEEQRRWQRRQAACDTAEYLVDTLSTVLRRDVPAQGPLAEEESSLRAEYEELIRKKERALRQKVELIFSQRRIKRQERALKLVSEEDVFSETSWRVFGLRRRQIAALGAVVGGTAGGMADVSLGGLTLFGGAALGGALGAIASLVTAGRAAKMKVLRNPLGRRRIIIGPARGTDLMFVLLNRARLHYALVALRTHAERRDLVLDDLEDTFLEPLSTQRLVELKRLGRSLSGKSSTLGDLEQLRNAVEEILLADEMKSLETL